MKRTATLLFVVLTAICIQALLTSAVSAHSLSVTASASCVNNAPVISYTATSWNQGGVGGSNTEIDIFLTA